jgi:hypothetical protein
VLINGTPLPSAIAGGFQFNHQQSKMATDTEYAKKVKAIWESAAHDPERRWARPEAPILHDLPDEKAEPYMFFHNSNYRISRKHINAEKTKVCRWSCS